MRAPAPAPAPVEAGLRDDDDDNTRDVDVKRRLVFVPVAALMTHVEHDASEASHKSTWRASGGSSLSWFGGSFHDDARPTWILELGFWGLS